tara:strand:+ start:1239 stop:1493 length:255 start_codon:yes stop_codon:yes gene_type:complete
MNNLTTNQSTENLMFNLHDALIELIIPRNEFIFINEADILMNEFQEITEENYTKKNLVILVKKYKKITLAAKLQVQTNEILASL